MINILIHNIINLNILSFLLNLTYFPTNWSIINNVNATNIQMGINQTRQIMQTSLEADMNIKYNPSVYDPLGLKKYPVLLQINGFIDNHINPIMMNASSKIYFGNFSIASINARLEKGTLENAQEVLLENFINTHHPTILMLQGLSKDVMNNLEARIRGHYNLSTLGFVDIDRISMKKEYKPIIYDTKMLNEISSGNFSPPSAEETTTFATFATFEMRNTRDTFTVVNVDLYSADEKTIETQLFVILEHIKKSYIADKPIFLGGTINVKSKKINRMFSEAFKNLVAADKNNSQFTEDTFHDNGKFLDGISRDFIFLRDTTNMFKLNYSRVLKGFDQEKFKHYPIYAILTRY